MDNTTTRKDFLTNLKINKSKGFDIFKKEKSKEIIMLVNEIANPADTNEFLPEADFEILVKTYEKVREAVNHGFEFETLSELEDNKETLEKREYENFVEKVKKATNVFNVYLYGDKGNGKSYFCKELAKSLNKELIVQNSAITPLDFQGTKDIQGRYTYSLLELAFLGGKNKKGAVLVFEEMDSYNPDALIYLNSILEQKYITTLDGEIIEKHPNTIVVACGNTDLLTPSMLYSIRNTIDIATADRFYRVFMPNFEFINKKVAGTHYEVINKKIEEMHKKKSVRNFSRLKQAIEVGLNLQDSAEAILTE